MIDHETRRHPLQCPHFGRRYCRRRQRSRFRSRSFVVVYQIKRMNESFYGTMPFYSFVGNKKAIIKQEWITCKIALKVNFTQWE